MIKQLRGLAKPKSASYKCSFHVLEVSKQVSGNNFTVKEFPQYIHYTNSFKMDP